MIELPESHTIARQLNETVRGKTIVSVTANSSPHKFAFFWGDPDGYPGLLCGKQIGEAVAFGGQIEIKAGDVRLLFNDGANIRYFRQGEKLPVKHQLLLEMDGGTAIVCTIQMYGCLCAYFSGTNDNPYYLIAKEKPSPLSDRFDEAYFTNMVYAAKPTLSVKALLATEQRVPGLGNGVLQDILYEAGIHAKRKRNSLSSAEISRLYQSVKRVLNEMTAQGGRDTEKDIFGGRGGYQTRLSKKTVKYPCLKCGGGIVRESYLGGNIYYCPVCQPLEAGED